jgi:hypothetical protein
MQRRSTGLTKLFKPTFAVFSSTSLQFYSDDSLKKLDQSCLTKGSSAAIGAKDPLWFSITNGDDQIILKTDSIELTARLVSIINGENSLFIYLKILN